jgi:hypothetical protein
MCDAEKRQEDDPATAPNPGEVEPEFFHPALS